MLSLFAPISHLVRLVGQRRQGSFDEPCVQGSWWLIACLVKKRSTRTGDYGLGSIPRKTGTGTAEAIVELLRAAVELDSLTWLNSPSSDPDPTTLHLIFQPTAPEISMNARKRPLLAMPVWRKRNRLPETGSLPPTN